MKRFLSRRRFHQVGPATIGVFAFGCGEDQRDPDSRPLPESGSGSGGGALGSGGGALGSGGGASGGESGGALGGFGGMARTCGDLTRTNIEGPFYLAGSPERTDLREDHPGLLATLSGVVYDTNCQPIAGALLDFWQANEEGVYDEDGLAFRGHQVTSEGGRYTLATIVPGRYLNGSRYRPAHLHVKVIVPGFSLTTQLYFPNDPFNEGDTFFLPELLVEGTQPSDDAQSWSFDFYLPAVS
jgi:protocatechuate 3,4-dioxygenase beta subunit